MNPIPLWRRFAIAGVALVLAGGLFRGQLGTALVTRGDDAVRNGDRTGAVRYYTRALAIDPHSLRAADRLVGDVLETRACAARRATPKPRSR